MPADQLDHCLACGSWGLEQALDLGLQPPANLLLDAPDDPYPTYPLRLNFCPSCGHGQLSHAVSPAELFGSGYRYMSGVSQTHQDLFAWFASCLKKILGGPPGFRKNILDIGCNDGTLLKYLYREGFNCLGIEPDEALANLSRATVPTIRSFWPCGLKGKYDAVVAWNVLAHGPSPHGFLHEIARVLEPWGLAFVLCSKSDMLETGHFDSIYHEHVNYFNEYSMCILAGRCGLQLFRTYRINMQGGSNLYVLGKLNHVSEHWPCLTEEPFGLGLRQVLGSTEQVTAANYNAFHVKATDLQLAINAFVSARPGQVLAMVGAAAKAMVVLHSTNIRPRLVLDEAPTKIGKWIPREGRMVQPLANLATVEKPVLAVLSAWNFAEELEGKVRRIRGDDFPTEFLTYFPTMDRWS